MCQVPSSNLARGRECLLWVLCVIRYRLCDGLITRPEESYRLWFAWVWWWSHETEENLVHWGQLRHGKRRPKSMLLSYYFQNNEIVRSFLYFSIIITTIIIIILYIMELGHLLTRSGLTYPEISWKVYRYSFCQLGSSVWLPWVVYFEAFYLHIVSSFSRIPVIFFKIGVIFNSFAICAFVL